MDSFRPAEKYSYDNESNSRRGVETVLDTCFKHGEDITLQSPNGGWFRIAVSDAGVLTAVAID